MPDLFIKSQFSAIKKLKKYQLLKVNATRRVSSGCFVALLLFVVGFSTSGSGQTTFQEVRENADKLFELREYEQALPLYENLLQNKYSIDTKEKVAACYSNLGNHFQAVKWYGELANEVPQTHRFQFLYAKALMQTGQYEKAKIWFKKYVEHDPGAANFIVACDKAEEIASSPEAITIYALPFNSTQDDYAPAIIPEGIVFVSARQTAVKRPTEDEFTNTNRYDILISTVDSTGVFASPEPVQGAVNTKFHEGPVTFSADGKTVFFTRNNYHKGSRKSKKPALKLGIYQATVNGEKWTKVRPFEFNSKEYSVGHPCLSPNGNTLYFVSDMPGGVGGTDIYYCEKQDGEWTAPVNAGDVINTPGNESFPFINGEDVLYFASDYHPGIGGLDIFHIHITAEKPEGVQNAGVPINSPADDYGLVTYPGTFQGYLTSNRDAKKGEGNLYIFWDKTLD